MESQEKEIEIRGILHCHSTYSYDGKMTLRELRDLCIKRGVQFICMTEHTDDMTADEARVFIRECDALSDTTFKFIPGFEVPYQVDEATGNHAHVLMIGCREFFKPYAPDHATLHEWSEHAAFVVLAHPVRNDFIVDPGLLHDIDALEVWNQQYEGKRVPRTRSLALLEDLRKEKQNLIATGGVDFHRIEHFGSPLVNLSPDTFTEGGIIEELKKGAFTVHSARTEFYGSLPNVATYMEQNRLESTLSVAIIDLGKWVNKTLAERNLRLPKWLRQVIRKRL